MKPAPNEPSRALYLYMNKWAAALILLCVVLWCNKSFAGVTGTVRKISADSISITGLSITGPADSVGESGVFAGQLSIVYVYKNQIWQGQFGSVDNGKNCAQSYVAHQLPSSTVISRSTTLSREQPTSLTVTCLVGAMEYDWTGPVNPPVDPVSCTSELTNPTLNWYMRSNEVGAKQKSVLHTTCTSDAALSVTIDNSTSVEGSKDLGNGVNIKWSWPNGPITSANSSGRDDELQVEAITNAALIGNYLGSLVIIVNYS